MSGGNPFRPPPPSPPLPPLPQRTASPALPPPTSPSVQLTLSSHGDTAAPPAFEENFDDDLPPPYTPAADASIGEETIGLGPRRPFQQPPPLPSSSRHPSAPSHSYAPPPAQPSHTGLGSGSLRGPAPWQNQQQYRQRQTAGGGLFGALFDTVRDIADIVSGTHDERVMATRAANAGAYAAPYSSTGTVLAPPPGPPRRPTSTPSFSPSPAVPDDGTPTRTPTPGHPLLRDGNLLVYPRDYLCVKCKNTGYRNYDPSNPCRKCWEKYAKPYTGALAYTPWSPFGNDPRMQRALPKFTPPHLAGLDLGSSSSSAYAPPPPPRHPHHNRSVSQPHHLPSPASGPSYYVLNPLNPYESTSPIPHAIPVSPGDPRLGGRLCARCGGEGVRTLMLIDVTTCDGCAGTGRVWV